MLSLEVFVTNLTDEEAWASGARFSDTAFATDFGNFFVEQGINVSPNDKRELGIRYSSDSSNQHLAFHWLDDI